MPINRWDRFLKCSGGAGSDSENRAIRSPGFGGYSVCGGISPWLRCFKWQLILRWSFTESSTFLYGESYTCCKRKLTILSKHTRFVTVKVEGKNFSTAQELTKSGIVVEYWFKTWRKRCKLAPWSLRRIWWLESRWKSNPR